MSLIDLSISPEIVDGDFVRIRLVPLSAVEKLSGVLWQDNAKKHDEKGLLESIERFGFIDPPHWDSALNGGRGGIVFGNGRTESIVSALIEARKNGLEPPRGIPTHEGEWLIPISFGVDQESEGEAIALGIDHNNLTMAGDFNEFDIAKMWDMEGYIGLLSSIADLDIMPITVDAEAIGNLLLGLDRAEDSSEPVDEDEKDLEELAENAKADDYVVRVKPGEIWKLGRHIIAAGDCCLAENIARLQEVSEVKSIEMVWADPPYGYSYQSNQRTKSQKFEVLLNDEKILSEFIDPF